MRVLVFQYGSQGHPPSGRHRRRAARARLSGARLAEAIAGLDTAAARDACTMIRAQMETTGVESAVTSIEALGSTGAD